MSLKSKLLLVLGFTILFLLISNLIEQFFIIYPQFVELEEREALQDNDRVDQALRNELEHLDMLCGDWAIWDDSYEFVQDANEEYIESNLEVNTLISAKLNLILFLDVQGEVVYKRFYDLEKSYDIELKEKDLRSIIEISLGDSGLEVQAVSGILSVVQGPLLLSSRPVLTSEGTGPAKGTIVMGRLFTDMVTAKMEKQTGVPFSFRTGGSSISSDPTVDNSDRNHVLVQRHFKSLVPSLNYLIETRYVREITRRGLQSIYMGEILFAISALVLVVILYILTKHSVIRPLRLISDTTSKIRTTGDYSIRIPSMKKNEIGSLAAVFNLLLDKIERQTIELLEANSSLNVLARIDGLTGLYNRRTFDEMLKSEWLRLLRIGKPLSIILCDVDNFKKFNDFYGHQKGDEALKAVGDVLKKTIMRSADGAFRYGGEEFCIILPDTDSTGTATVAERVRQAVENLQIPHVPSLGDEVITISLGFSTNIPSEEGSLNEALSEADEALYEAKRTGRNCTVQFEESLRKKPTDIV